MTIQSIEDSKLLRKEGRRLGRAGMSQRAHALIAEYIAKHPDGHYIEAIALAGRLHAISLASRCDGYWGEKSGIGFRNETWDIQKFQPETAEAD